MYFENNLKELETEFGFEYKGEISPSCNCEMCLDETLSQIRSEMEIVKISQPATSHQP